MDMGDGIAVHDSANICGDVEIGMNTRIDAFVTITGKVKIGRNVHISTGASIFGGAGVTIGDYAGISAGVKIFTGTEDLSGDMLTNPTVPAQYRSPISKSIVIGAHCVIGAGSVLLPGAELEEGVCVGALSLVKAKLKRWHIYAGIPAEVIKSRRQNLLDEQIKYEETK